jgi:hypothetical protein
MPTIACHVDERTFDTLRTTSADRGCSIEHLAECAIAEAALAERRDRLTRANAAPRTKETA